MNKLLSTLLIGFLSPALVYADNKTGGDIESQFSCVGEGENKTSKYFPEIQKQAEELEKHMCKSITAKIPPSAIERKELAMETAKFGALVETVVVDKGVTTYLDKMGGQASFFKNLLTDNEDAPPRLVTLMVEDVGDARTGLKTTYFFPGNQNNENTGVITENNNHNCRGIDSNSTPDCIVVVADLKNAIDPYQANLNKYNAYKTKVALEGLSDDWDRYFKDSRYQNSLGIALTTLMEKKHFDKDHLVGPPKRQWHAIQPGVVIENVSDAEDGENVEYSLAMEWIGVNWWEDSIIGIPLGVSLVSIYADRSTINDVGHGVMFHFDNKYSVGISDHDGESGVFVTMDLLKLFMDKKKNLVTYREKIHSIQK